MQPALTSQLELSHYWLTNHLSQFACMVDLAGPNTFTVGQSIVTYLTFSFASSFDKPGFYPGFQLACFSPPLPEGSSARRVQYISFSHLSMAYWFKRPIS